MKKTIIASVLAALMAVVGFGQICPPQIVFLQDISVKVAEFEANGCTDLRVKKLLKTRNSWEISQNGVIMPSILVSGAGSSAVNGTYTERGTYSGKAYYNLVGQPDNVEQYAISWVSDGWWLIHGPVLNDELYISFDDVATPDLAIFDVNLGDSPAPTVTAAIPPPVFRHHYQNQGMQ